MTHLRLALLALALTACATDDDGSDDPGPGSGSSTYSNHVRLECQGSVLVDRTFTSKAECTAYASSHDYMCLTIKLTISC